MLHLRLRLCRGKHRLLKFARIFCLIIVVGPSVRQHGLSRALNLDDQTVASSYIPVQKGLTTTRP
jgi:hypothetical protein